MFIDEIVIEDNGYFNRKGKTLHFPPLYLSIVADCYLQLCKITVELQEQKCARVIYLSYFLSVMT